MVTIVIVFLTKLLEKIGGGKIFYQSIFFLMCECLAVCIIIWYIQVVILITKCDGNLLSYFF